MIWQYVVLTLMGIAACVLIGYAVHLMEIPHWIENRRIRAVRRADLTAPSFEDWVGRHYTNQTAEMPALSLDRRPRHYSDETAEMHAVRPPVPPRRDPV